MSCLSFVFLRRIVFVSSKSCIYITPSPTLAKSSVNVTSPQISCCDNCNNEPIYENIENGNIVPSGDNKFTIYVNYDEIVGKSKSSVRVLEPDVQLFRDQHRQLEGDDDCAVHLPQCDQVDLDGDESSSKMIQCQQISMYIGEMMMMMISEIVTR